MPSKPPKPQQAPYESNQRQTNTYAPISVSGTPEAQSYLNTPLDFGDPTNVNPGIARGTDLEEQEAENRYQGAFNMGTPAFIRQAALAREKRDIRGRGASQMAEAEYLNQQGNNQRRQAITMADLARKDRLLPQILQTGGTSNASGFNTQFPQSQPGFWQRLALGVAQGAASGAAGGFGG